jgi:hypothetical protein
MIFISAQTVSISRQAFCATGIAAHLVSTDDGQWRAVVRRHHWISGDGQKPVYLTPGWREL